MSGLPDLQNATLRRNQMVVILRLRDYSSKIGLPFDSYETLAYVAGIHMDEREFGRHHERIVLPENSGGFREGFHEWIQGCLWNYTASFQHSLSFSEMSIAGHLDRTLFSTETRKLIKDWELKTALKWAGRRIRKHASRFGIE